MPTYDYTCPKCKLTLQIFHKMSESPITKCRKCKKVNMEKGVGGGSALHFKGTGFYETDYKDK